MTRHIANTIACAVVSSRLDYCNSLLAGVSGANLDKLQRVQNALARVVTGTRRRDHITPILAELHWLPVRARITFKIATLVFKIRTTHQPPYLDALVVDYIPARTLRSASKILLREERPRTAIGARSFRHTAAKTWNGLPDNIRQSQSLATFRTHLKKHLYELSYST